MRLAHIKNGIVINISIGDLVTAQELYPDELILESNEAGIGWTWNGEAFIYPESSNTPENFGTKITRLAFRNRFTTAEKVALYTAAESNMQIKIYLDDVNSATFIDLSRPDTRAGVQTLEAVGILGTGRALEILDAPVSRNEVWDAV